MMIGYGQKSYAELHLILLFIQTSCSLSLIWLKKVGYLIIFLEHDEACFDSRFPELLAQEVWIKHLFLLDITYFIVYNNIKVLRNNS